MLAGRRPFAGASDLELVQTIIHGEPARLNSEIPVALRFVVEKALEKDPAERYQTMREMVVDLRRLSRQPVQATVQTSAPASAASIPARRSHRGSWRWAALTGALALALGFVTVRLLWFRPLPESRNVQFQRITDFIGVEESPAISPDGKTVAFVAQAGRWRQIWIRLLAGGVPL